MSRFAVQSSSYTWPSPCCSQGRESWVISFNPSMRWNHLTELHNEFLLWQLRKWKKQRNLNRTLHVAPDFLSTLPWEYILVLPRRLINVLTSRGKSNAAPQISMKFLCVRVISATPVWFLELERDRVPRSATPCTWNSWGFGHVSSVTATSSPSH